MKGKKRYKSSFLCNVNVDEYIFYELSDPKTPQGSFYIQIEPNITVGPDGNKQVIPLDAIRCQTVLSKCLGPLSTWENKLIVSKNSGYNVVHFTPIQVSQYCLSNNNVYHTVTYVSL